MILKNVNAMFPNGSNLPSNGSEMALARLPFCLQVTPGWSSMLDLACKNLSDASCLENVFFFGFYTIYPANITKQISCRISYDLYAF